MERTAAQVAIIVLNWNGRADTLECLRSLAKVAYSRFNVIVADNGSSDGSEMAIRDAFPWVTVLQNGANLGFAGGNNRAIQEALEAGAEFILLLNNDTVVDPGILSAFVQAAEQMPRGGVFGPKIYRYDDKNTLWYAGGDWDSRTLSFTERGAGLRDEGQFDALAETDWVIGCGMFVRASVFRKVGLLESRFFLNNEEIDFCSRARRAGFSCVFVPGARMWHKISVSFGGELSPMKEYFSARNRLLWAMRNADLPLRLRIYSRTVATLTSRFLRPLAQFSSSGKLSPKAWWWRARQTFKDPRNRAYLRGVGDFCVRRFGNCPEGIRELTKQWVQRRASTEQ